MREAKKKRKPRIAWAQIRDRVHSLSQKLRREVTTKDVRKDANSVNSPFHKYLEWDDKVAGEKHRMWQCAQLLSHLKVIYHDELGKEIKVREFVRLVHESPATHELRGCYVPRTKAMTNSGLEQQCVERAIGELESWMNRWRGFQRIEAAYAGVQASLAQLRRLRPRALKKTN